MLESFVDLSYRGLPLGRRIKLTHVRPSTGYLEHPTPMPVGTPVSITTDDGLVIDAVVTAVHEQVGGATDQAPGMTVHPMLADPQRTAWWSARVTLPEVETRRPAPVERARSVTVRPRTQTTPEPMPPPPSAPDGVSIAAPEEPTIPIPITPVPEAAAVARLEPVKPEPPRADAQDKKTMVMDAVDQEMLEHLSRTTTEVDRQGRSTDEHPVVDDGQRTTVMDAVDPSALGLELSSAADAGGDDEEDEDSGVLPINGTGNGAGDKKAKKRRKKRR